MAAAAAEAAGMPGTACQAMPAGGTITVTAAPYSDVDDPAWCQVILADTGQGIASDFLDKIFDPFFTTKTEGTGLGLAIAYRIIEDHEGTISVESEAGKGTRFFIRLPLFEESAFSAVQDGEAMRADA